MPKPETIIASTKAVVSTMQILLLGAIALFAVGIFGELPELRRAGVWVCVAAVCVAFLPLLYLLAIRCWRSFGRRD